MKKYLSLIILACIAAGMKAQPCVDRLIYSLGTDHTASVFDLCVPGDYPDTLIIRSEIEDNGVTYIVTGIQVEALMGLKHLSCVSLPETMRSIGADAFNGCTHLGSIISLAVEPPTMGNSTVFKGVPADAILYVPSESIDDYANATGWSVISNIMPLPYKANPGDTISMKLKSPNPVVRLYFEVTDTTAGSRAARLIAPRGGYDRRTLQGTLVLPDSVADGMGFMYQVNDAADFALRGCTDLRDPVRNTWILAYQNRGVREDTIPAGITRITGGTFIDNTALRSLECCEAIPPACSLRTFAGLPDTLPIYVSKSHYEAYRNAPVWGTRQLAPRVARGDTVIVNHRNPNYSLLYEITDDRPGSRAVRLVGDGPWTPTENLDMPARFYAAGMLVVPDSIRDRGGVSYAVTEIQDSVLMGNENITGLSIGKHVCHMGAHALGHCPYITSIEVNIDNPVYHSRRSGNAIVETATNRLVLGCASSIIEESVRIIGAGAFCSQINLEDLFLPANIESIEPGAFHGCTELSTIYSLNPTPPQADAHCWDDLDENTRVFIPAGTILEYQKAWPHFSNFKAIPQPGNPGDTIGLYNMEGKYTLYYQITNNSYYGAQVAIVRPQGGYREDIPADSVNIRPTIMDGQGAVYSVTEIADSAFAGTKITHLFIGENVRRISHKSLHGCDSLHHIEVVWGNPIYHDAGCDGIIESKTFTLIAGCRGTTLVPSIRLIGDHAMCGLEIDSIRIPESIMGIGLHALAIPQLTKIICEGFTPPMLTASSLEGVSRDIPVLVPQGCGMTYRASDVWGEFTTILEFAHPTQPGDRLRLPIGNGVNIFFEVQDTVAGSQSVMAVPDIGEVPYYYIQPRGALLVPDSVADRFGTMYAVTSLAVNAYRNLTIDSISLPATLHHLCAYAMSGCDKLRAISCHAITPPQWWSSTAMDGVNRGIPLYVPAGSVDAYREALGWKEFSFILPLDEPTSVTLTQSLPTATKVLINGRVFIRRGEQLYDLMGHRIR